MVELQQRGTARRAARSSPASATKTFAVAVQYSVATKSGKKKEDAHFIKSDSESTFLSVFDGAQGSDAAEYLKENLYSIFEEKSKSISMATRILEETYIEADKKLINYQPSGLFGMFAARGLGGPRCFSTGATVYIKDGKLTVANIGDVKAILGNSGGVRQLSVDHVGSDEDEQQRIQEAVIASLKEKEDVTAKMAIRVPENFFQYGDACTYPGFTWQLIQAGTSFPIGGPVTRGFGSAFLSGSELLPEGYGFIAKPAVTQVDAELGSWVILASAPVWRHLTAQEAMDAAKSSSKGVEGAAEAVLGAAALQEDDDATVMIAEITA